MTATDLAKRNIWLAYIYTNLADSVRKSDTAMQVTKSRTTSLLEIYKKHREYFTDGSKAGSKVARAFAVDNAEHVHWLTLLSRRHSCRQSFNLLNVVYE